MMCGIPWLWWAMNRHLFAEGTGGREEGGLFLVQTPHGHHLSQAAMISITG